MAEGLNRATLIGHLGADPELRHTQNNRAVLKFRIATTETYLADSGERKEITHWHNIVLWGKRAEALAKILSKGSQVYVEGRIENRSYDDKDGIKRNVTDINCQNLILIGGRRGQGGGGSEGGGSGGTGGGFRGRGPDEGSSRPSPPSGGGDRDAPATDDLPPPDDDIPF